LLGWQSLVILLPGEQGRLGGRVIRKRGSGLQVQVYAGRDPLTGRKRWVSRQVAGQTKASHRQAKKVEAELLEQVDRGEQRGSRTRTVGELVEHWFTWRQQVRPISPITVRNYRGAIERYILPALGRAKVREVDAATLDALYAQVRAHGGKCRVCWQRIRRREPPLRAGDRYRPRPGADEQVHQPDCARGWPLSASAVQEVHTVLSGAFKQAVVWGWAGHNPAKLATAPAAGKHGVSPPDAEGVARLLTAAMKQDPELGLFLRLAVVLGARRGELISLKWRDVDLDAGAVLIASSVARVVGRPLLARTPRPTPSAASPSVPTPSSCCAPIGSPRPRTRSPAGPRWPLTPMCSPTSPTVRPRSTPTASPTASAASPGSSACAVGSMTCGTSW
jgi:integrase